MSVPAGSVYFPPPPPSPSSPSYTQGQRRPQQPVQPPTIYTDLVPRYGTHLNAQHTPASASFGQSPFSPTQSGFVLSSTTPIGPPRTSLNTMNAYNPQEWGRAGAGAGQHIAHTASTAQVRPRRSRETTGMETHLPEPPPPYSESTSPDASNVRSFHISPQSNQFGQSLITSPVGVSPNPNIASSNAVSRSLVLESTGPATAVQQAPPISFPPPPGTQRDRSGSRTKGVLNNIAAFASSRSRASDSASPANSSEWHQSEGATRAPAAQWSYASDQVGMLSTSRRSTSAGVRPPSHDRFAANTSRDRSTSNDRSWEQGMQLPGPPPGPPPSSRSQSMNRVLDRTMDSSPDPSSVLAPIPTRVARGSTLGPVPPTPADWVDEDQRQLPPLAPSNPPLRVNTQQHITGGGHLAASVNISQSAIEPSTSQPFSPIAFAGLSQAPPAREPSLSIRDRRNETRARSKDPSTVIEPSQNSSWLVGPDEAKPANLVLSSSNNSGIGRRRHVSKAAASPRSGQMSLEPSSAEATEAPTSSKSTRASPLDFYSRQLASGKSSGGAAPTPPFSTESQAKEGANQSFRSLPAMSNKSLPTPPDRDSVDWRSASARHGLGSASRSDASPLGSTLRSAPLGSAKSVDSKTSTPASNLDEFARGSLQRFERFLANEVSASNDQQKLELFAEFVVNESRFRRDRYPSAFESMGSDVLDLTRDMWRSFSTSKLRKITIPPVNSSQPRISTPRPSSRAETETPAAGSSNSSPGSAAFTPGTEPESPGGSVKFKRMESQRQNGFQPMLSPIPSMAQSTIPDETDSRGRAQSRWWEHSEEGSFGPGGRKIERSKRESKYMGLPREAREHLQWEPAVPSPNYNANGAGPSNPYAYLGLNEYPPEKVGWQEESTPSKSSGSVQTPSTPQPRGLDVSRLITLPPPYPRHHPAVNNSHPDLAATRAKLRAISDSKESASCFEMYTSQYPESSPSLDPQSIGERRRAMRLDIQNRVASGEMSFADAAGADAAFEETAVQNHRECAQKNFENFQKVVLKPLSAAFKERIVNATGSIDSLRDNLLHNNTPDQAQEEGDERPELLEKITLLKWLFEARETLHKDLFELQNQSDEKYKHVILAPYRVSANDAKIAEVQVFFDRDSRERILTFNSKAVKRFELFLATVEEAVAQGVEAQLSAFWDIAPDLLAVVQKVPISSDPARLHTFHIIVPPHELVENPPYADFPLQYLYTLLVHAEKSTYQFIESQTNLLCLLHEVKSGLMAAGCRVLEVQRTPKPGETAEDVARETGALRDDEDRRLTRELKDKVGVVEDQWRTALGAALGDCKVRIGLFLVQVGGWDEALEE